MTTTTAPHLTRVRAMPNTPRPTPAQTRALFSAIGRPDGLGVIHSDTHPRTVAVLLRHGWVTPVPGTSDHALTDAGRTAIGEPTTAAVAAQAERSAADRAAHTPGCLSWIDGDDHCDCARVDIGAPVDAQEDDDDAVALATVADDQPTPTHGLRGRRAAALIGQTATRASVVLGHDVDPDDETGRALCQSYADETGEPVAVHAVPYGGVPDGGPFGDVRVWELPYVGTFQPTVVGPCWDGHSFAGTEHDACRARATTTVPAAVWAPGSSAEYPANVPACAAHAREIWDAEDAAAARAEARATSADYLT